MHSTRAWLMSFTALGLLSSGQAVAQGASDQDGGATLTEVVVTAEKREGNVQTTPISIQVYSSEQIRERGISDFRQLQTFDTSLQVAPSAGGHPTIAIRGITSTNTSETGEPAVPVAIDGVFNNRGYSLNASIYDLERIEVLRGPQGTLFGRNTTGGMLNVITAKPSQAYSGRLTVEVGNYNAQNFDGYINGAITDTLSARLSFVSRSHDGYVRDTKSDNRASDEDVFSARLQLLYKPTDNLTAWMSASLTHEGGLGGVGQSVPFRFAPGVSVNTAPGAPLVPAGVEWLHTVPTNLGDGEHYNFWGATPQRVVTQDFKYSATYDDLPFGMTLTYLGGYDRIDFVKANTAILRNLPVAFTRRENPVTVQNEIRLSSLGGGRFVWQVGAYAYREKSHLFTTNVSNPGTPSEKEFYQFDAPKVNARSQAAFAQGSYKLTDTLKLTLGGRYTVDDKSLIQNFRIRPAFTGAPVTITQFTGRRTTSDKFTWLADLDYDLTDHNMVYGKISTGYKAGSLNAAGDWQPEMITSYELGSKNRFFDNRVQLNVAAYYMDYTDQQVTTYRTINNVIVQVTTNAGKSTVYGLESNFIAQVTANDKVELAANYLHARYEDFIEAAAWSANPPKVTLLNLAGKRLPNAPEWTLSARYQHIWENVLNGELVGEIGGKWQDMQYFAPENFPDQQQKAYSLVDASLLYRPTDKNWTVQAYVKNLAGTKYLTNAAETAPFQVNTFAYGAPRTYGVRVSAGF